MTNVLTGLIFIVVLCAAAVVLQIYLSKRESKIPGLVLPIIAFILSLVPVLSFAVYGMDVGEVVVSMVMILAVGNIPTAVLLAIYFASRERSKKGKEIDRMNIQDLD